MNVRKKIGVLFIFFILFLASATATYFWRTYQNIYVAAEPIEEKSLITNTPTPTPDPLAPKNILLLGYGGSSHVDGTLLTDTIIVAHVIPRDASVTLISIPRDVLVPLEIKEKKTKMFKINHAYAIGTDDNNYPDKPKTYKGPTGGGNMAKDAVEMVTGLKIDYFVSIDFVGFLNIIDALGGVNVYVPYTFTDNYYPIPGEEDNPCEKTEEDIEKLTATMSGDILLKEFTCRFETLEFTKGALTMDGETALKFVRSRHSEVGGSDFGRSQRQQALLVAIKNKLLSYKSIPKLISIINILSKNVRTDIDIKTGVDLLQQQTGLDEIDITTISLTTDNVLKETYAADGQYILLPKNDNNNWNEIHEYIEEQLGK